MRKFVFIFLTLSVSLCLAACEKKKETLEEIQEPLSIEISPSPASVQEALPGAPAAIEPVTAIPLPPQGPYKPSSQQIQTALKNAGYYAGKVDGKIGPLSKEAIKKFQAANNLNVDGKVGPKTWELLSKHLSEQPTEPAAE